MKQATKVELGLVAVAAVAAFVLAKVGVLPGRLSVGALALSAAAVLLGQGLIRDLWTLRRARQAGADAELKAPAMTCMCVESTVGMAGVVAGAVLVLVGIGGALPLTHLAWGLGVLAIGLVGVAVRDWVVRLRPLGIMHVPDHGSIRVTLKPD